MSTMTLKGIIRNGRVEVTEPITLPEGTEVVVSTRGVYPPSEASRAGESQRMTSLSSIGSTHLSLRPRRIKAMILSQ